LRRHSDSWAKCDSILFDRRVRRHQQRLDLARTGAFQHAPNVAHTKVEKTGEWDFNTVLITSKFLRALALDSEQ
jgi:hypothetical protein